MKVVLNKEELTLLASLPSKEIGLIIRVLSVSDVVDNGEIFLDHDARLVDIYRKIHDPYGEVCENNSEV